MATTSIAPVSNLMVMGDEQPDFTTQGGAISWDYNPGVGETAFFNNSPAGDGGGFAWYQTEPGTLPAMTTQMYLDRIGNLIIKGLVHTTAVQSEGDVNAGGALVSTGNPTESGIASNALLCFDPAGTGGSGSADLRVTGVPGQSDPAINLQAQRGDGTNFRTYLRGEFVSGREHVLIPTDLDVTGNLTAPNAVITNPTADTDINPWPHNFDVYGRPPAAATGNGVTPTGYVQIQGNNGQDTTGAAGNTGGNGSLVTVVGGNGGAAPAGSTNGNGGTCYIAGGKAGSGAGTPGIPGDVLIQRNWGNTFIGGHSAADAVAIAHGGATTLPATLDVAGEITANGSPVITQATLPVPPTQVYPPAGVPQSTGTGWGASIPAADIPRISVSNTFAATQRVNGGLGVYGPMGIIDVSRTAITLGTASDGQHPNVTFIRSGAAANNRAWAWTVWPTSGQGEVLTGSLEDDTGNSNYWLAVWRNGTAASNVTLRTPVLSLAPPSGSNPTQIDFGGLYGTANLLLYHDPTPGNNYGIGINAGELQFFIGAMGATHFSWNGGGALQPSGTNELMRLDSSGNLSVHGAVTLSANPTQPLQAATKQYVDNSGPKVIEAPDEATAISNSAANPNNIYFWT